MTIPAERLREGKQILVRGKISFSRLAQLVDGDALVKSIEQARKRGVIYPTTVPHTTINLFDAQVIPADSAVATLEETFVHEHLYVIKSGDNAGKSGYSIDNKGNYLPTVLEQDPANPGQYRQLQLERDLAGGIEVTLVLQVFKPATYEKRGLGLQQVVLNEPVRYFASGVDTDALAARGIVVNGPIRPVAGSESIAASAAPVGSGVFAGAGDYAAAPVPANSAADANGFAVPTPGAQGVVPVPTVASQAFPLSTPVAAAAVAAAAPVATAETPQQQIARLQQQIAESAAAQAGSGGGSAFDAAPVAPATQLAAGVSPWDVPTQAAPAIQV